MSLVYISIFPDMQVSNIFPMKTGAALLSSALFQVPTTPQAQESIYGQVQVKQGQMGHFKRPFLGTQFEGNVV